MVRVIKEDGLYFLPCVECGELMQIPTNKETLEDLLADDIEEFEDLIEEYKEAPPDELDMFFMQMDCPLTCACTEITFLSDVENREIFEEE